MIREPDFLYRLLPEFLRYRDADPEQRQPLRALMSVLETQYRTLAEDIDALYDNWFIETCDGWAVPYLAELLGIGDLTLPDHLLATQRVLVANTLGFRRRKGTPAAVVRAVHAATGWHAYLVPGADRVAAAPHLGKAAPAAATTINLADGEALSVLGQPFDRLPRTADVRGAVRPQAPPGAAPGAGLDRVGLFLWRLQTYPASMLTARRVEPPGRRRAACYTFHPLGLDAPLFNAPETPGGAFVSDAEPNLPTPLRRQPLARELEALRAGVKPASRYFASPSVMGLRLRHGEEIRWVPPAALRVCDLSDGWRPRWVAPKSRGRVEALVDPELGRLVLPDPEPNAEPLVSYRYGFSTDVGGGPYPRPPAFKGAGTWQAVVFRDAPPDVGPSPPADGSTAETERWEGERETWKESVLSGRKHEFRSLAAALAAWELVAGSLPPPPEGDRCPDDAPLDGRITIADNVTYGPREGSDRLAVTLWPDRRLAIDAAAERCPVVGCGLAVAGAPGAGLILDGLWLDGDVEVSGDCDLRVRHSTLRPASAAEGTSAASSIRPLVAGDGGHQTDGGEPGGHGLIVLRIAHSIVGPLRLPPELPTVEITDSIVDGGTGAAIAGPLAPDGDAGPGPAVEIHRSTVFGSLWVSQLPGASNSLFTAPVRVEQRRYGEVRYSFLAPGSETPRRHLCQPDLALATAGTDRAAAVRRRLVPQFTSRRFGDPAYAQLAQGGPPEIARGAEGGSEMGVFFHLHQPQREAQFPGILQEYLPYGYEAIVRYVT